MASALSTARDTRDAVVRENVQRGMQERDTESFRNSWKPADALPMPKAPDGWHYRYVRKSIGSTQDVNNFGKYMREGWETVPLADHPELASSINPDAKSSGLIEIGALILCKLPKERADARTAYFNNMTARQMDAVDNNLMRENDPRMPLFNSRDSKVSFGKGG